jgi:hypothetical protein
MLAFGAQISRADISQPMGVVGERGVAAARGSRAGRCMNGRSARPRPAIPGTVDRDAAGYGPPEELGGVLADVQVRSPARARYLRARADLYALVRTFAPRPAPVDVLSRGVPISNGRGDVAPGPGGLYGEVRCRVGPPHAGIAIRRPSGPQRAAEVDPMVGATSRRARPSGRSRQCRC